MASSPRRWRPGPLPAGRSRPQSPPGRTNEVGTIPLLSADWCPAGRVAFDVQDMRRRRALPGRVATGARAGVGDGRGARPTDVVVAARFVEADAIGSQAEVDEL